MYAERTPDTGITLRNREDPIERGEARTDRDHSSDPGFGGPHHDLVEIIGELVEIEMAVTVYEYVLCGHVHGGMFSAGIRRKGRLRRCGAEKRPRASAGLSRDPDARPARLSPRTCSPPRRPTGRECHRPPRD